MPIFIDREAGRQTKRLTNAKLSKAKETAVVQAFADEITAAGYKAGVYASYSWYNNKMNADDLSDCAIWIARYNNTTTSNTKSGTPYADVLCDYEFWQYSSTKPSSPTGYTGNLGGFAAQADAGHRTGGETGKLPLQALQHHLLRAGNGELRIHF